MAEIKVKENEPLEKAIKRFKKKVEREGIIRDWKRHEYFEKPSTIRNRKKKAAERKRLKKLLKQKRNNN
jgi:small subunit ribosomal protein S21